MIGRTRLPLINDNFDRSWGDQLVRSLEQNFDRTFQGWPNYAEASGYFGSFYSTVTQSAAAINTPYAMTFSNTDSAYEIGIVNSSRITFKNRGHYNIQFSTQLDQPAGATSHVYIWFRKNGVDIPNSTSVVAIQGTSSEAVPAWNFIVGVLGGDYVQIMWAVDSTNVQLTAAPATGFCPAIPSVIATATSI